MIEVEVNHSALLGPPRNQGRRPTCLAFTTSDLNAFANATSHLSVEFLCHHAARVDGGWEPGDGFTVDQVFAAVTSPGQPEEVIYPYRSEAHDAPLQAPPDGLIPLYRSPSNARALALSEVVALVRQGRAVGVVVAVTKSLFYPRDGMVEFDPFVIPDQFHAMVAVGFGTHRLTSETHIYLRNSWGAGWGNQGHAWVPERHLKLHMQEGFSV